MADENKVSVSVPAKKQGFAAAFDVVADAKVLQKIQIAKSIGGASAKEIVELGVNAYLKTDAFKKKAELIRNLV